MYKPASIVLVGSAWSGNIKAGGVPELYELLYIYVEIFTVDLISLVLQIHAPTVKFHSAILTPHTCTSPITDDQ